MDEIIAANAEFYQSFRDFDRMNGIWATDTPVFCLHPGQVAIVDRNAIMASWRKIIDEEMLTITPISPQVFLFPQSAIVVCEEDIGDKVTDEVMVASNLFVPASTKFGWAIAGHHAGRKSLAD